MRGRIHYPAYAFAENKTIDQLEENLKKVTSVTKLLDAGYTPQQLLEELLGGMGLEITDTMPARFTATALRKEWSRQLSASARKI